MNKINGIVFSENNVIIVNGRVISGGGTSKLQKFDERKAKDCSDIDKIAIDTTAAEVNVSVSNSSKVEAHFYGEAEIEGDVNFDVQVENHELRIILQFTGNCFNRNLKLDVTVPQKKFKVISAKSSSADITVNKGVSTNHLKVKTQYGNLEINATVNNVSASTMSGNVELCIDAIGDVSVEVSTKSGDVSAEFNNIADINLFVSSRSGDVKNRHKGGKGYTADVNISTMSGNIRIR